MLNQSQKVSMNSLQSTLTLEQTLLWLILALGILVAFGVGYYLRVCFTLLSVTCQILQTLAFHTNQMSSKLSALLTGEDHGKDLHKLIEEEKFILERIETMLADTLSTLTSSESSTNSLNADPLRTTEMSEVLKGLELSINELRGVAYNSFAIRKDVSVLAHHLCPEDVRKISASDSEAERKNLHKAVDKIEKSQIKDLGSIGVNKYRELLQEHVPSGVLEDLETYDSRIHRYKDKYTR
jgi:hypothetical protein